MGLNEIEPALSRPESLAVHGGFTADEKQAFLTPRILDQNTSPIRDLLALTEEPDVISFAGGLPAPDAFPSRGLVVDLANQALTKHPDLLQYQSTEGFRPLREAAVDYLRDQGLLVKGVDNVMVTTGSQGALNGIGAVFTGRPRKIIVEGPGYLGAFQAFNLYGAQYLVAPMRQDGMDLDVAESYLRNGSAKVIYGVPNFQNPTGLTMSLKNRWRLAEMLQEHGAIYIEDDPYGRIRFKGEHLPPVQRFAPDNVVYLTTFSKLFAPGLRIGLVEAPEWIIKALVKAKQGVDLFTGSLDQGIILQYLAGGHLQQQLPRITSIYQERLDAMLKAMETFPHVGSHSRPDGGLFLWWQADAAHERLINTESVLKRTMDRSRDRRVAFVPGSPFYANGQYRQQSGMRLNFSNQPPEAISYGIPIIGQEIRESLD